MKLRKLLRSFYLRPTLVVAKDLLGKYLIRMSHGKTLAGMIVEVEAYLGEKDAASHAFRGRTKRNEVMFRNGGHLYVYFTYGMHYCCNVVTGGKGKGRAVLIRGIEPVEGIEAMAKNRGRRIGVMEQCAPEAHAPFAQSNGGLGHGSTRRENSKNGTIVQLTNGPAKLCEALGIGRAENGTDLLGDEIFLAKGEQILKAKIATSARIGIRSETEKMWRFYIKGNRFVSG